MTGSVLRRFFKCVRPALVTPALVVVLFWNGGTIAQEQAVFEVRDVVVDVTARSASDARKVAIAQGQRLAFTRLFKKLVAEQDWALEPAPLPEELTILVQGFDVVEEKSSTTRYLAKLNVTFAAERVRALLGNLGVSFAETKTRPTLVLPMLSNGGTVILWGKQNLWAQAWRSYPLSASLVSYRLPNEDAQDWTLISPRQTLNKRSDRLNALMTRYDVTEIILAHAELSNTALKGAATLKLVVSRGASLNPLFEKRLAQLPDESVEMMMARGIAQVDATLSEAWKSRILIQYGTQQHLEAGVAVDDFTTWRALVTMLEATPQIRALNVDSLGFDAARISFDYFGGIEQLQIALQEQGIQLIENKDGSWVIYHGVRNGQKGTGEPETINDGVQ